MKTLNKLKINPERIIESEELITLRGGYGSYVKCIMPGGEICHPGGINSCSDTEWYCNFLCIGWEAAICVGW